MHSTHWLLAATSVFVTLLCLTFEVGNAMYLALNSTPTDIQVSTWDGSIVVSAGEKIHRMSIDFTLNGSVTTHDQEPSHRIALSHNSSETILVCKDSFCTHYYVDWEYGDLYEHTQVVRGFDSIPLSVYPEGFYIGTTDGRSIKIKHFDEEDNTQRDYNWASTNSTFYQRKFLQGFQYGSYAYFIVQDNGTSLIANNVRVIRVCHELDYIAFNAAYEAVLDCGKMSQNSKVEVSSNGLNGVGTGSTIVIAVTTENDTNLCSFSIDNINSEMDASYAVCSSRQNANLRIPLVWYNERTCAVFSESVQDMCNFDLAQHVHAIPALATFNPVPGQHLLQFNESKEISAVLSIKVGYSIDLLFVAYTTTSESHFLETYYVGGGDGTLQLISSEQHELRINLLRWNEIMEEMYGANTESVFLVPLERCSDYTTCDECTRSNGPLCGWCSLEQYCSRDIYCPRSLDKGRWVNSSNQCIASVSLATESVDVDQIKKVELVINPQEAVLPSPPTQGFQCGFYHRNHENISYEFTAPFEEGACQLPKAEISEFEGKSIDLNFTLQLPNKPNLDLFPSSSVLTLHNCSLHTDCRECVEASTVCGWCVYDRICTGNASICRHKEDWRSLKEVNKDEGGMSVCPMVVTPEHNSYTLPVNVERDFILSTLNIPSEIHGYQYGCVLKYGNGSAIELEPYYRSETEFRCLVSENQVLLSSDVANGTEATELELLWIRNTDNYTVALHTIRVILYNCLELGTDCSSCLSANLGTGFECIWCDRQQRKDECTIIDYCQTESTAVLQISGCPPPLINSTTLGRIVVTINGSNLSAVVTDVRVELILLPATMEGISCLVDETKYIPVASLSAAVHEILLPIMKEIKNDINSVKDDLNSMKKDLSSLNKTASDLPIMKEIKDDLNSVKDDLNSMKKDLSSLNKTVSDLPIMKEIKDDLNSVKNDLNSLNKTVSDLSEDHNHVTTELMELDQNLKQNFVLQLKNSYGYITSRIHTCGGTGGWRRVVYLNFTDPNTPCPSGWQLTSLSKRTCGRVSNHTVHICDSVTFPVSGGDYNRVCGRIRAYQYSDVRGFQAYSFYDMITIDDVYVAGVSLTHGSPRKHIWTFAAGLSEFYERNSDRVCPCDATINISIPPFVGGDYFCESGYNSYPHTIFFPDDPLWDGNGCIASSTCCSFNNPPYFTKQLPSPTTDDIEARLCHYGINDDIPIEFIELYVQP